MTLRPNALSVAIQGSKGGQGSQHTPTEARDSLHDVARIRILDLLMEGESAGFVHGATNPLRDVYLNETPVCNADDSFNFSDIKVDSRSGTQDQDAMSGFGGTESETGVGVELRASVAWSQALTNLDLSAVRIRVGVDALQKSDAGTGDINGYRIEYKIELSTDGAAYVEVGSFAFNGKTSSSYERTHRIDLPTATTGWTVRVTRTTPNSDSATIGDTTRILSYTEIVDAIMRYPNSAYVGLLVDAKQFQSVPARAYDMLGRIMSVPSNYDPVGRTYTGTWDGTFKPAWTNNPAWVFYDLVTNTRFGLGKYITPARINKWALYTIAQYCDGLVPDGKGGQEPRFTCTLYLQTQAEAYKVLADLVSVFRGITYWSGSMVQAVADMPGDPDFEYNPSNVIEGKFEYAGSGRKTRYTVALVSWNDPADFGRAKVEYVPDREGIARYGIQATPMIAVGATSASQARRAGLWALLTSRLETETVTWGVGQDGVLVAPGRICRIADPNRSGKHQGGRVSSVGASHTNLAPYSTDFSQWSPTGASLGAGVAAPDSGVMTRLTVTTAGSTVARVQHASTAAVGTQYILSVYVRKDQYQYARLYGFGNGANGVVFNLATGVATIIDSWDSAGIAATDDPNLVRVWAVLTPISSGTINIGLAPPAGGSFAGGEYLDFWGAQLSPGTALDDLIVTQADPVTAMGITVDQAPEIAASGDTFNVMLPSGVSESKPILSVLGRVITVSGPFSETPVPEAVWTVDAATLATQTVRVLTVREQIEDGKSQYVLTGVKHNASKFDAVDYGATAYEPPTVSFPGNSQTAPAAVSLFAYPVQYASSAGMTLTIGWDKPVGAVHYWVQYRRSNGEWTPRRLTSSRHVDIKNVLPGTYEATVVAVNALGIESNATLSDPLVVADPNKVPGIVDDIKTEVDAAKTAADKANADLANIAADGVLTPVEKKRVILDYNVILTEQVGIDAQATSFGITTEKTAYDGKVTALVSYLNTLTSPTDWNDTSGDTTIVRDDFRAAFKDVYTAKQTLLNAIYAAAKQKAQDAQDQADQAHASVVVQNSNFTKNLNGWTFEASPGPVGSTEFQRGTNAANSPYAPIPTHLIHNGVAGQTSAYAVNQSYIAVQPKQLVTASVALRSISANSGARAQVFVRFYDKDGTYLGFVPGEQLLDPVAAPVLNSTVKKPAPANAAFARVCILYSGHTSGVITATCAMMTATITDQDDLQDGASYSRSMNGFHSETVDNATFSLPLDKDGNVPGWKAWGSPSSIGYISDATYSANVLDVVTNDVNQGVETVRKYACKPGDYVSVTLDLYTDVGTSGAYFQIRFYQANGALVAGFNPKANNTAFDTWQTLTAGDAARAGSAYFTIILYTSTSSGRFRATNVRLSVNDVRVVGSRVKLGDQRNMPTVTFGNYGSAWSGLSFSYTATTTSATITASAATLWAGDNSVAYNSASVTVTGTAGTTKTYYLYYDDPDIDGGSQTLRATTSNVTATANNRRLRLGTATVTFPASGTGSGSGGSGPCPVVDAWVIRKTEGGSEYAQAGSVRVGDFILKVNGEWGLVTYSKRKLSACVRVVAGEGRTLSCSRSAPLGLEGGGSVLAPDANGRALRGLLTAALYATAVVERVEILPDQWVQHITCEDDFYWVGDHPAFLFSHHNLKPG